MINLEQFLELPMSNGKAYICGLILPKLIIGKSNDGTNDGSFFELAAQVNHGNSLPISQDDLIDHIMKTNDLLKLDNLDCYFNLRHNSSFRTYQMKTNGFRKGGKGFYASIVLDIEHVDETTYTEIRNKLMNQMYNELQGEYVKFFIAGNLDGRSSFDTTIKCFSIDIDDSRELEDFFISIASRMNMDVNINNRNGRSDSSKANQLRYKKDYLKFILRDIPMISTFRKNRAKQFVEGVY